MKKMEQKKLGRLTFLPLNRLPQRNNDPPRSTDYLPLLDKLKYDTKLEKAMKQVFGKKMLCRDMTIATQVSEKFEVDCVTLEGDEVNRKGGLSGGYVDPRRSRLKAMDTVRAAKISLEQIAEEVRSFLLFVFTSSTHFFAMHRPKVPRQMR
jgi:structural maintenance of chromosome 3 (chondroitin sulfate proteoglycan 6)